MAGDIHDGVQQIEALLAEKHEEGLAATWRDLRNKLDSMLLSTNILKTNECKRACAVLDSMTTEERSEHISQTWGPLYLEKAQPILIQLESVERQASQD